MRDRLADSRFDIIRLSFRSSILEVVGLTLGFGSSEPGLKLFIVRFSSSEPESEDAGFGFEFSKPELGKKAGSWF